MIDKRMMFARWFQQVAREVQARSTPEDTKRILVLYDRYFDSGDAARQAPTVIRFTCNHIKQGGQLWLGAFDGCSTFEHAVDMVLAFPCNGRDDASVLAATAQIHVGPSLSDVHIIREGATYLTWRNWAEHRAVNRMQRRRRKKERRDDNRWLTRPECPKRVMKQLEQTFTPWEI